ncbi:MAG: 50S ribosomal protein L24 [Elusimicrobiales bacterium]
MTTIKAKDTVVVLCGKDKGKRGEVRRIIAGKDRVLVAGVNMVTKHARAAQNKPGGIQKKEMPLHISNVALVCPKCNKAAKPKAGRLQSGDRVRLCRKCGETL